MQFKLDNFNLNQYFSVVDTGHTFKNLDYKCPFNFINNNSDILTVTVGDSWTWGADMTASDDTKHRLTYHFGRIISDHLQSDWLNLGQRGSGNFWLYQRVEELCNIIPNLHYKKIYVICTLTEVGRAVNSTVDIHIDYIKFFKNNPPNKLVEFLNQYAVDQILCATKDFLHVVLKIGTNFVDHVGIAPAEYVLPDPWIKLCCMNHDIVYHSPVCSVTPWAIDAMHSLKNLVPSSSKTEFLQYMFELSGLAISRLHLLKQIPGMRHAHPNRSNHKIWADYIIQQLV